MLCKTLANFWSSIRDEKVRQILIYRGLAHHSLNKVYTILIPNKAKHGVFKMTLPNLEKALAPLGTSSLSPPRGGLEQRCDAPMRNLKNHQI